MNEVVDTIEQALVSAVRRRNRRGRRRRVLAVTTAALLVTASLGFAALPDTPIDRLLHGDLPFSQAEGAPRIDLRLTDEGGLDWTMTTYRAKDGTLASTASPDGLADELPPVGGANGFVLADSLLDGPLAGAGLMVVTDAGRQHYLLTGSVGGDARAVTVALDGQRRTAVLADDVIALPVSSDGAQLTAEGRRRAAQMPDEVRIRPFAVTFSPDVLAGQRIVQADITVELADGAKRTQQSARFCISTSCGARIPEVRHR